MKYMLYEALYEHPCPGCGQRTEWKKDGNITLNIHCTEERLAKGLFQLWKGCRNAECEWSKVLGARQNEWFNQ